MPKDPDFVEVLINNLTYLCNKGECPLALINSKSLPKHKDDILICPFHKPCNDVIFEDWLIIFGDS